MRIGVDATCWTNRRGYGRFARALLMAALKLDPGREYVFFTDDISPEFPLPSGVDVVRVETSVATVKAAAADGARTPGDMLAVSRAISARELDLIFFPSVYSFVPILHSAPLLVTIHDVIPERFPELVFPTLRGKMFWRAKVALACAQARLILTVSEYSRRCLAQDLRISPRKLRVVSEAGDPAFTRLDSFDLSPLFQKLSLPRGTRFLAYVGGFSPHKNLIALIGWFSAVLRSPGFDDVRLVLVGDYQGDPFFSCYPMLQRQIQKHGLESRVLFPGYMRDDDLRLMFHAATALVLPSMCEGFGLPAVEAAACGTPVLVTTESPLPEILGEGALAIAPDNSQGWVESLTRVLSDADLRNRMSAAGMRAASGLSWRAAAAQLLEIFDEVTQRRAPAA